MQIPCVTMMEPILLLLLPISISRARFKPNPPQKRHPHSVLTTQIIPAPSPNTVAYISDPDLVRFFSESVRTRCVANSRMRRARAAIGRAVQSGRWVVAIGQMTVSQAFTVIRATSTICTPTWSAAAEPLAWVDIIARHCRIVCT